MSQLCISGGQSTGVSASTSVLPMNTQDYISFRMDWFDLLAVQGTLKSLLQHHSSKASILEQSAFFIVQLSHPYMTTEKTISSCPQSFPASIFSSGLALCIRWQGIGVSASVSLFPMNIQG